MVRFVTCWLGIITLMAGAELMAQGYGVQGQGNQGYGNNSFGNPNTGAQDSCYVEQQACNRQCGRDSYCQSTLCFERAVACKRRQQQAKQEQLQRDNEQQLREQARQNPKTYVLPPLELCASVGWEGEVYWEFLVTNNCPAAVEVDVTFSGGTIANVFCEGFETCKAKFPKKRVGNQFNYRFRYVSE